MMWLIIVGICAAVAGQRTLSDRNYRTQAQLVMDSIPPEDRGYFVTYHLALEAARQGRTDIIVLPGFNQIPEEKHAEFALIRVTPDFSRDLLEWTEHKVIKWVHPKSRVSSLMVCFPNGCVDPNDVGQVCCPF